MPCSGYPHCVKSVRIPSYSGPRFSSIFPHSDRILRISPYSVQLRENSVSLARSESQFKKNFFYFELFFQTKVSQNAFDFSKLES